MMEQDMKTAADLQRTVRGVKGPSPLINVPGFDIVCSFRPDYMHTVLLGVVRQMTDIWCSSVGKAHYIGSARTLAEIDDRLLSQRPPLCFNRVPRSLKLRKYWKASEWEAWLLYYSLPCLKGTLAPVFLEHFALLVSAVYTLLKSHVTAEDVDCSTKKITEFVVMTQCHYGAGQMTSNMHTLLHLPKSVLLHGPLWAVSCFEFESNMGRLVNLVSSSNGIPFQILSRIFLVSNFHLLQSMASQEVKELCGRTERSKRPRLKLLGKPQALCRELSDYVMENISGVVKLEEYSRVSAEGCTIHSKKYKSTLKRDSSALKVGDEYARVENIVNISKLDGTCEVFIISAVYHIDSFEGVDHLKVAVDSGFKKIHSLSKSLRPCVSLELNGKLLFAELCNRFGSF
uniref:Cr1-8 nvi n=1 Tax=Rhipicephalus zambeziensis TaxID=60191 RepID=A0A224YMA5_9ACAR